MLNELTQDMNQMHEQLFFSSTAQSLLSDKLTDEHFLNCLVDRHCFSDAVTYLAHTLEHSDGIRWARACISNYSPELTVNDSYLLTSVTNWLNNPTLSNRERVLPNHTVQQSTPAMWLALASYWSGDSELIKDGQPENLVNNAIYSTIMMLMQQITEADQYRVYLAVINSGIDILLERRLN